MCLSETEPVILLAVIALSVYHGERTEDKEAVPSLALEYYTAAIAMFREKSRACRLSPISIEVGCLLFACIEFFLGDAESALIHISGTISFISSRQPECYVRREETALAALLSRLSLAQSIYGRPRRRDFPPLLEVPDIPAEATEHRFYKLSEVRTTNTALLHSTFRFVRMAVSGSIGDPFVELSIQRVYSNGLRGGISLWRAS